MQDETAERKNVDTSLKTTLEKQADAQREQERKVYIIEKRLHAMKLPENLER